MAAAESSMPVVAPRVIVAELSRMPTRPMTTPPLGTATVALAEKTCELVVQFVIAPVPLPLSTAPSANSEPMAVQPDTAAVIAQFFHVANKNIRSPAAGEPGMATVPSAMYSAHVPAVLSEIATD